MQATEQQKRRREMKVMATNTVGQNGVMMPTPKQTWFVAHLSWHSRWQEFKNYFVIITVVIKLSNLTEVCPILYGCRNTITVVTINTVTTSITQSSLPSITLPQHHHNHHHYTPIITTAAPIVTIITKSSSYFGTGDRSHWPFVTISIVNIFVSLNCLFWMR